MKVSSFAALAAAALAVSVVGCKDRPAGGPQQGAAPKAATTSEDPADVRANLSKLPPEDRKLAEGQGFCAVEHKNPLGSMGVPVKVTVKGQPVFLCCDGCETRAKAHADRTLARVQQLKEKRAGKPAK